MWANELLYSDVLHPNRPNVSKDELRQKLSELYKSDKDQVSVFGFRTQYGGGKSTGFALVYDSAEAMKKFEPHYRLVRYGQAAKIEKPSRQQRTFGEEHWTINTWSQGRYTNDLEQASSARTGARSSVVSRRRPAVPTRRRNRRLDSLALLLLDEVVRCISLWFQRLHDRWQV
jgi:small subunit ribosomal protein S24e